METFDTYDKAFDNWAKRIRASENVEVLWSPKIGKWMVFHTNKFAVGLK